MIFRKMLIKDFLLNTRELILDAVVVAGFTAYLKWKVVKTTEELFFFLILISVLFALMIYTREDRFKGNVLTCSLPCRRRTVVLSKYLNTLVWVLAFCVVGGIVNLLVPGMKIAQAPSFSLAKMGIAVFFAGLTLSAFLPFIIAFGFVGVMVFLVAVQLMGIAALVLSRHLEKFRLSLRGAGAMVKRLFSACGQAFGPAGVFALLLVMAIILLAFSYALSCFIFSRKDL